MRIEPEIGGASLIFIGQFSPSQFNPDWLLKRDVITEVEAAATVVEIVHPEICQLQIGAITFSVETDRCSITTSQAPWVNVCDLALRLFVDAIPQVPLIQMGINREAHFSVGDEHTRNEIGRLLAPLEPWGEWGKKIASSKPPLRGGMLRVSISEEWKEDPLFGRIQTAVEPSVRLPNNSGIYVQVNDHCQVRQASDLDGTSPIIQFLAKRFDSSIASSDGLIDQVMSLKERVR